MCLFVIGVKYHLKCRKKSFDDHFKKSINQQIHILIFNNGFLLLMSNAFLPSPPRPPFPFICPRVYITTVWRATIIFLLFHVIQCNNYFYYSTYYSAPIPFYYFIHYKRATIIFIVSGLGITAQKLFLLVMYYSATFIFIISCITAQHLFLLFQVLQCNNYKDVGGQKWRGGYLAIFRYGGCKFIVYVIRLISRRENWKTFFNIGKSHW